MNNKNKKIKYTKRIFKYANNIVCINTEFYIFGAKIFVVKK